MEDFQIRAMDAAVYALWAVCRHWQDLKAAIIAGVRGKAKPGLLHCPESALSSTVRGYCSEALLWSCVHEVAGGFVTWHAAGVVTGSPVEKVLRSQPSSA